MTDKSISILACCAIIAAAVHPARAAAGGATPRCEPYVPMSLTQHELQRTGFRPGGIKPFLLGILAGPRIALEWNDGRGVRTIELLRSVPYFGNLVGLYLCTEALSRNGGIARFAVERDTYSAARERLVVHLTPVSAGRTKVEVTAAVQARVERRGEIQYEKAALVAELGELGALEKRETLR